MGLLQGMSVKVGIDLSAVTSGIADLKERLSGVRADVAATAESLQTLSDALDGAKVASAASVATDSIAQLSEVTAAATPVLGELTGAVDGSRIITNEDVAQAKLTLIESKVAEARETLQTLQNAADAGQAVTGIPEAEAKLTLLESDAQDAREQLAALGSQAEETSGGGLGGFASRLGGLGGNLLDFTAKIGQAVFGVQQLGQAAIGMIGGLFGSAVQIEQTTNSFAVFDGSMQKAQTEMGNLADLAAHSPFQTDAIDQAALKMQGVGIAAQNVRPDILALGDALDAGGRTSSADLDQIVANFDKIQTTGHLTSQVMQSFSDEGVNAWGILEKQTGKSQEQLQKMISAGLYPANQAMHDLTAGIEASPLYSGQMANDTNSMAGIMSTLKSNWDQALASFASPVMKDLEPVMAGLASDLASSGFKDFAGSIGSGIASVFGDIGSAAKQIDLKGLADQVQRLGNWFKTSLQPALEKAEPGFDQLASTVSNLAQSVLPPLIDGAGTLIPQVVALAGDVSGGLATAITGISSNFSTWGPIVLGVGGVLAVTFIPAIIKSGIESAIAGGKMAAQYIVNVVQTGIAGWQAAGKMAAFIGSLIASGAQAVVTGVQIAAQWTASVVAAGVKAVIAGGQVAASFVANLVASGAQAVVAGAQIVGSFVASLITTGVQAAATGAAFVADLIPAIVSFAAESLTAATTAIPAILVGFGSWVIGAGAVAIANIAAFWPIYLVVGLIVGIIALVVLAITHWSTVMGGIKAVMGAVRDFFVAAWQDVQAGWNDAVKLFETICGGIGNAFSGLGKMVSNIWGDITGTIKGAINWVIGGINNFINFLDGIRIGIPAINVGPFHSPAVQVGLPHIPDIPLLSTGGVVPPGTFAVAGDPGPHAELVYGGTAGATVFSHEQSQALLAGSGGNNAGGPPAPIHVHIYLDSQEMAEYVAEPAAAKVVAKLLGHGPVREAA